MNQISIDTMLSVKGFYATSKDFDRVSVPAAIVEVESDGTCHQIDCRWSRDGVLPREGWLPEVRAIGPFATGQDALDHLRALWKALIESPIKRVYTE